MKFSRKTIIIVVALFLSCALFLIIQEYVNKKRVDKKIEVKTSKYILMYTNYYYFENWLLGAVTVGEERLKSVNCSYTNCVFTNNKTLLSNFQDYDALVIHSARDFNHIPLPTTRSSHQVYVSASKESPPHVDYDFNLDRGVFNWTMTYRLDADVQWLYGRVDERVTGAKIAPAVKVDWMQPESNFQDEEILQIVKNKTKTAAWFVSHCQTPSKREVLVEKLQKFIDVDVYGECGPLQCEIYSTDCARMLNTTYRFYLAFENSLCVDYMTEKLYLNMLEFVIPVVYAGVELSRFLPPKSYIDANEFKTVEDLAKYLKYLAESPNEYVKYFWWRKHYKIVPQVEITSDHLCDFCKKLNEPNLSTEPHTYGDIKQWFNEGSCSDPKIQL